VVLGLLACLAPLQTRDVALDEGDRDVRVVAPRSWDGESSLPVVFLLHGLGSHADQQDRYLRVSGRVDELDFILVAPDAMPRDKDGQNAWNATPACCKWEEEDDVAWLSGLMDELEPRAESFHFYGHSNGGFMSYRMACEDERVDGIASLAGSTYKNGKNCPLDRPVDVLQIHGVEDRTVPYDGKPKKYPGAVQTAQRWAFRAGCTEVGSQPPMNLTLGGGDETRVDTWSCPEHRVELWSMDGVGHVPAANRQFSRSVLGWLLE
jgi:polyhydroxybutyrate depolymerase